MKTAVESIIEKLQQRIDNQKPYIEKYNIKDCRLYLYKILDECMEALELEKEQIMDAHCAGQDIKDTAGVSDAEQYYSETYKKPEHDGK